MMKVEPFDYYIGVYKKCKYTIQELKEKFPEIVVTAKTPKRYVLSLRYLMVATIHFIETMYIKKWIKNQDLRFLAFLLRETQIDKIIRSVEEDNDKVLIIVSKSQIPIEEICDKYNIAKESSLDMDNMMELAIFRGRLEKEKSSI